MAVTDESTPLHPASDGDQQKETAVAAAPGASPHNMLSLGIGYMLAMGVCGVVLVAIGSGLSDLAELCGTTSTKVATVFIARGVGAILGAVISARLYFWFHGNMVIVIALLFLSLLLFLLPVNTSVAGLHILFFLLGLATAVTDTGCQIMTRKIHGKSAGPWLGANTVAFGIAGALVPLIDIITTSLYAQYSTLAVIVLFVSLYLFFSADPEKNGRIAGGPPKGKPGADNGVIPHYHVEMVIALMVFCFIGGKVTMTSYLDSYVDDTGLMSDSNEEFLILVLWIAITIGRLAGVYDQRFLTNKTLPVHLTLWCIGGAMAMLLILWFPNSVDCLWIGIAFYGLFNGPCVGYCYDWNNRITYPTEISMSIVMFGLNFGASLVPYLTATIWNNGGGPTTLMVMTFLSMSLPLPLLHISKYLSYDPAVNPTLKNEYMGLPQDEPPI
jgi:predicted MFS family arabinose efflux permease